MLPKAPSLLALMAIVGLLAINILLNLSTPRPLPLMG